MKRTLCSLALAAALAACAEPSPPPPPDTTEADIAAIRADSDRFLVAYNAQDLAAFEAFYTDDAIALVPEGPPVTGKDAVIALQAAGFEHYDAVQTSTTDEVAVFGDHALAWGTWEETQTPKAGGPEELLKGKWLVVYKRQPDGSWKTWRWMWNQDTSAPPSAN